MILPTVNSLEDQISPPTVVFLGSGCWLASFPNSFTPLTSYPAFLSLAGVSRKHSPVAEGGEKTWSKRLLLRRAALAKMLQISYNLQVLILSRFLQVPVLGSPKAFKLYFPFFDYAGRKMEF